MRRRTLVKWGVAVAAAAGLGNEGANRIGAADVARLNRATARLCSLDHRHGGETLWQAGTTWVHKAYAMLDHGLYSSDVQHGLLRATGNLQIRVGWLACDAGEHDVARASFSDAVTVGRQGTDAEIESRALAGLGFQCNLLGQPREGRRFSNAATDAAAKLPHTPRAEAASLLSLAVAGARSGEAREADQAITRARKALDADHGDTVMDWAAFLTPTEIDAVEATCAVETGKSARAEKLLERAIAGYDDGFARNIALYRVRLAQARILGGDLEGAVESADAVLDELAGDLESWRVRTELARVVKTLGTYADARGVDGFLERYTAEAV